MKFLALTAVFIVFLSVNSLAVAPYTLTGFTAANEEIDSMTGEANTRIELTCYGGDGSRVSNQDVDLEFYDQTGNSLLLDDSILCSTGVGVPYVSGAITKSGLYYVVAEFQNIPVSECAKTGGCKLKAWFSITQPFVQMNVPDNNAFLAIAIAFGVMFIARKK